MTFTGAPDPLGTNAESIHAASAGEGVTAHAARLAAKRERHDLLRAAQSLLWVPGINGQDQHRTCWCHRTSHSPKGGAQVFRAVDGAGARLGGIVTCGQVWTCPVCAAKIAETRRHELSVAMGKHIGAGGHAYLLTFTFPHDRRDALAAGLEGLAAARQRFQNSRTWKAWVKAANRVGAVTSLEVTYGSNGWHPHLHMLCFADAGAFGEGDPDPGTGDLSSPLLLELASLWVSCLERAGLVERAQLADAMRYSFNCRGGAKAAEYVAKYGRDSRWGQSSELTKAHAKVGRRRAGGAWHVTPFQLLALIVDGDDSLVPAWHEYVAAFKGRRMLTWTPGLKRHFDVLELDDEDLAAEGVQPQPEETWVGSLTHDQLRAVTSCAALGALLEFVASRCTGANGQAQLDAWVARRCPRPRMDGDVRRRFEGSGKFTTMDPHPGVDMSVYA